MQLQKRQVAYSTKTFPIVHKNPQVCGGAA